MYQTIFNEICNLINKRSATLSVAFNQRAKFEGWLKIELAAALHQKFAKTEMEHPCCKQRIDIFSNGTCIELKTVRTTYQYPDNPVQSKSLNSTIKSIIKDIDKLRSCSQCPKGVVAFVMFPVDQNSPYQKDINKVITALGPNSKYQEQLVNGYYIFSAEVK